MPDRHPDQGLLAELEPVAEQLLNRHLAMANDRGSQAAFEVNLLTEDNLSS